MMKYIFLFVIIIIFSGCAVTETKTKTPPQNLEWDRIRMFYVNRNGYIYHWRWKGL